MKKERKNRLVVTPEAIADFSLLSYAQRLRWLDGMRSFLGKVRSSSVKYHPKIRPGK
jgi:hypothetical protein